MAEREKSPEDFADEAIAAANPEDRDLVREVRDGEEAGKRGSVEDQLKEETGVN